MNRTRKGIRLIPLYSRNIEPTDLCANTGQQYLRRLTHTLIHLGERCLACGTRSASGLCRDCFRDLPWNDHPCRCCAIPLETPGDLCGHCALHPPGYDRAYAAFEYAWPIAPMLQAFKFHGHLAVGRTLALAFSEYLVMRAARRPDILVPVPLHPRRLSERGFNQAIEIARPLARSLGITIRYHSLIRRRHTPAQSGLGAAARRRNLSGAFACKCRFNGLHVALVDDVITTGSTAEALAATLKQAGARHVSVYALARA